MHAKQEARAKLAVNGGPKVRTTPFPGRSLIGGEEKAAVDALFDEAIETGDAIGYNGPVEEAYCQEFAEFMGGGYADAVNSGTAAIFVALRALGIEPFTEVVVSPITDPGAIMPVPLINCIPVVADTKPGSYNTGPEQVEAVLTPLTSAIIVGHILGEPADVEAILEIARARDIPVIEDCAQAHCARLGGKLLGTFGDVAVFSTMFGKHFCSGGQGGIVYTRNEDLYWQSRRISDRGKPFNMPEGSTNCIGSLNLNLNDLAAAIGREQLKKLPGIIERRRALIADIARGLAGLRSITIPEQLPGAEPSYWFWRLEVNIDAIGVDKMTYCKAVAAEGPQLNPSYGAYPHTFEWYEKKRVFGTSAYPWSAPEYKGDRDRVFPIPNARAAVERQFNLTVYESWGQTEVDDIVTAFRKVDEAFSR